MDAKRIGIVGAGISGLISCKYVREKGFIPMVFEMKDMIGGVWLRTLDNTLLQTSKTAFQFSDFPWPSSITSDYPTHGEVLEYIQSYARHFQLLQYIQCNSKVVGMEFLADSCSSKDGFLSSKGDAWSGEPFSSGGKWQITVHDALHGCSQVHRVDFVIVCTGRYGDIPELPSFEAGKGPEVFKGKVVHAVELYAMDHEQVDDFISGKKIVVVGFQKTAFDVAAKCAGTNGVELPCTMICRDPKWHIPHTPAWSMALAFLFGTRFSELMDHKPGESFPLALLATFLSPLRWTLCKLVEICLQWQLPLKKYGILPEGGFFQHIGSVFTVPRTFYNHVETGTIVIKKYGRWSFRAKGLILESADDRKEEELVEADLVILATGYKSYQKLKEVIEASTYHQIWFKFQYECGLAVIHVKCFPDSDPCWPELGSVVFYKRVSDKLVPLFISCRECIHPRIPEMAIIGYTESISNLFTSEMEVRWLVCFLAGGFRLPSTRDMEEDIKKWDEYKRKHSGYMHKKPKIITVQIWYNDKLCKDMGCKPWRKRSWLSELFLPYGPADYSNLMI